MPVHKAFGDICLAYQLHLRGELNQAESERDEVHGELNQAEKERDVLREALDQQREAFEREIENIRQKVSADILQRDKQVAKAEAQIELERKEKTALVGRLKEVEQISEERERKIEELQGMCDEFQQCTYHLLINMHYIVHVHTCNTNNIPGQKLRVFPSV